MSSLYKPVGFDWSVEEEDEPEQLQALASIRLSPTQSQSHDDQIPERSQSSALAMTRLATEDMHTAAQIFDTAAIGHVKVRLPQPARAVHEDFNGTAMVQQLPYRPAPCSSAGDGDWPWPRGPAKHWHQMEKQDLSDPPAYPELNGGLKTRHSYSHCWQDEKVRRGISRSSSLLLYKSSSLHRAEVVDQDVEDSTRKTPTAGLTDGYSPMTSKSHKPEKSEVEIDRDGSSSEGADTPKSADYVAGHNFAFDNGFSIVTPIWLYSGSVLGFGGALIVGGIFLARSLSRRV